MDKSENMFALAQENPGNAGEQYHDYQALKDRISLRAREKGIPLSGKFELTPLCNLSCKMCYVHLDANQLKGQSVLPVHIWKELMYQAWKEGMISASLTGGECLTYPGFDELYYYLQSLGCEVNVLTNGILMDEKRIQFFKDHTPYVIQVTLYGCNDDVYEQVTGQRAFTTVVNNIKEAVSAGLPVCIAITPNRYLGEDLLETIRIARGLCSIVTINTYYTVPREETGRSGQQDDADLDLYIRALQYNNRLSGRETVEIIEDKLPPCGGLCHETSECGLLCGGGRSSFAIDWKGIMTPCTDLYSVQGYPLQDGFSAAWSQINQVVNHWPRVPECIGCAYEKVCNRCAAVMLQFAEPGKMPLGYCERTRAFVRSGIKQIPECME